MCRFKMSPSVTLVLLGVLSVSAASPLAAQDQTADAAFVEHPTAPPASLPLTLSKTLAAPPLAVLAKAEIAVPEQVAAIAKWNSERRRPLKNGFGRPLGTSHLVSIAPDSPTVGSKAAVVERTSSGVVWASRIEVKGAYRLRLRLTGVKLPPDAQLWVAGDGGGATRFGLELRRQQGDLWTPSVAGGGIHLQVQIPESALSAISQAEFRIDSVAQIFQLDADGAAILDPALFPKGTECLQDAACFDDSDLAGLNGYKEAVAHLQYMVGMDGFLCSGALLNDTDTASFIPYMLTANHCFDTQASATTLEAFFDFIAPSCGAPPPSLGSLPRVLRSTLLATTANTDSTFVQLSANPSGSTFYLGWTTTGAGAGTGLYRLSHPMGFSLGFSRSTVVDPAGTCEGLPSSQFIYSTPSLGGTAGGSSGSPTVDDDLRVRGQLLGACGPDPENPCNPSNDEVDGRFSSFFSSIEEYLNPTQQPGCVPSATTLCLNNNRFKVEVDWDTGTGTGMGQVVPGGTGDSSNLWFFSSNNWEMLFKVLDGCGFNDHYWVYFAATTSVGFTATVTDTKEDVVRVYTNANGHPANAVTDTSAFATCP